MSPFVARQAADRLVQEKRREGRGPRNYRPTGASGRRHQGRRHRHCRAQLPRLGAADHSHRCLQGSRCGAVYSRQFRTRDAPGRSHGVEGEEQKEKIINYIKLQKVPYTVIDVAWWYQILPYKVPSGRIDYMVPYGPDDANHIPGEGNVRVSFSDVTAIGDKVARIIADPRTVNKYVHVYDEVMTYHQVLETLEDVSGEKIERAYKTAEQCQDAISEMNKVLAKDATNFMALVGRSVSEYQYSLCVRGDTTPEVADYLGYLDVYKLYPDLEPATLRTYYRRALDGKEAPGHMD